MTPEAGRDRQGRSEIRVVARSNRSGEVWPTEEYNRTLQNVEMAMSRRIHVMLLLVWPLLSHAQEVKYIELNFAQQRTELRHPPAPPAECKNGNCMAGGAFGGSIADGAPDHRDPRALGVYLLRITPAEIRSSAPFEAEFKIVNTGQAPMELPVYAHLSDLQPGDESVSFNYFSLALVVRAESEPGAAGSSNIPALGYIELYGSHEHEGTLMELKPGEWIRVRATMKLQTWPQEPVHARLRGEFWLRRNTFRPQAGGEFSEAQNLYPNATTTPSIPVYLLGSAPSEHSK